MKKMAAWVLGAGLTTLALSGCAAASAAGVEPAPEARADVLTPAAVELAAVPSSEFASAVGPVLESFPDDYAFFYFDSDLQPIIGFTSEAVPAVLDAVKSTGQPAEIIEHAGFTNAQYNAEAERLVTGLQARWPSDVPFPMIGARPDFGVGVIGVIRIADEGSADATRVIQESTRLIEEANVKAPFSIQIDHDRVFGEGHTASYVWPTG